MEPPMEQTLAYLRESLSNYIEQYSIAASIYQHIERKNYMSEGAFINELNEDEINFLNQILPKEMEYAKQEQDNDRFNQLNEVYELLY